jgi:hypothetical protein
LLAGRGGGGGGGGAKSYDGEKEWSFINHPILSAFAAAREVKGETLIFIYRTLARSLIPRLSANTSHVS